MMSQYSDDEQHQARVTRTLADSLADYTPPANGELQLPDFDDFEVAQATFDRKISELDEPDAAPVTDNPVPPVQTTFDGWSTSYDQADSGIKAEPDDFRVRPQAASDIESSFDITRVFSQTGDKLQRQSKEWGNATVAVFAARKEQQNLIWLGLAALVVIVALIWLFKPGDATAPEEHVVSIQPNPELLNPSPVSQPQKVEAAPPVIGATQAPPVVSQAAVNQPSANQAPVNAPQPVATAAVARTVDTYQPAEKAAPAVAKPAAVSKPAASKGGYTVQIAAAHNEANIKALAAKLPRPADAQIVRSWRDGKPWYVLSYGHFKTHEDAARARNALPAAIKTGNAPWVKAL